MSSTSIGTELDKNDNEMEKPEVDNVEEYQASVMEKPKFDNAGEDQASVHSKKQKKDKHDVLTTSKK